jgi:hypothetical protein
LISFWGSAWPATITQTHNITTHGPGNTLDPWTDSWSFNKFNSYNGTYTLTSVRVEFLLYAWDGFIGSDNDGTTTANGAVSLDVNGNLSASGVGLVNSIFANVWASLLVRSATTFNLAANDGDGSGYQTGGSDYAFLSGPTEANAKTTTANDLIADAVKGSYIGTDTFSMRFTSSQAHNVLTGGGVESQISPQSAKGTVKITYDYVIPEPAAIGLISLGGLVTLVTNRLRRKN